MGAFAVEDEVRPESKEAVEESIALASGGNDYRAFEDRGRFGRQADWYR